MNHPVQAKLDPHEVLYLKDVKSEPIVKLLKRYQLNVSILGAKQPIPGSYWGESEAGLIGHTLFVRHDTPVHSILHESCHFICMDAKRRQQLDTDAAGDFDEENAVCYLQILLGGKLSQMGSERMMRDMDRWGYTFRLGSAENWFNEDAEDARQWLFEQRLITSSNEPTYRLREE